MHAGAAGQVGTELVKLLSRRGERLVFAADLAPELPPHLKEIEGITYLNVDVSSERSVQAAFDHAKPDVWVERTVLRVPLMPFSVCSVFHLAGQCTTRNELRRR